MTWLDSPGFERRPLVFVEDHLYHTGELLDAIVAHEPAAMRHVTVCAIDRPGPDTDATVAGWMARFPDLQVAAPVTEQPRVRAISSAHVDSAPAFAKFVAELVRPGGVLVQDVQLSTLAFVPADRWWESIYVAATVRGLFAEHAPLVRFLSNKRGYTATFGRDLSAAGFDPRDVIDKSELSSVGVPALLSVFEQRFPFSLNARLSSAVRRQMRVSEADRAEVERALDIAAWPTTEGFDLCGRLIDAKQGRVAIRHGSHEAATWLALIDDRLNDGAGITVAGVGKRVGPVNAERAELSNLAARHIHTLRRRLRDDDAIATVEHRYRFSDRLAVGRVERHLRSPSI